MGGRDQVSRGFRESALVHVKLSAQEQQLRLWGGWGLRFFFCFFFTLVTGPRRSLSLKLSDTRVYEHQIRGTTTHFCEVIVLELRAVRPPYTRVRLFQARVRPSYPGTSLIRNRPPSRTLCLVIEASGLVIEAGAAADLLEDCGRDHLVEG